MMVDEKYKMVASHVDINMRKRIQNFEFVDFVHLLPHDKIVQQEDNRLALVNKGGQPWIVPFNDTPSEGISSYHKWHLAFRVYSDILTEMFPEKASELFQYEHIIHSAAQTFIWDNVYSYDKAFRIHISEYPTRTWAVILQQAYATKLKEKLRGSDQNLFNRRSRDGSPCRRFQRGKCNFGMNCKYQHRCTICNKYGHGAHICRKRSDYSAPRGEHSSSPRRSREPARKSDRYHYYKGDRERESKDSERREKDKTKSDKK